MGPGQMGQGNNCPGPICPRIELMSRRSRFGPLKFNFSAVCGSFLWWHNGLFFRNCFQKLQAG